MDKLIAIGMCLMNITTSFNCYSQHFDSIDCAHVNIVPGEVEVFFFPSFFLKKLKHLNFALNYIDMCIINLTNCHHAMKDIKFTSINSGE